MSHLSLVLVNPQYAQNVGFCSRACGNMGAQNLFSIAPECDLSESKARQGAAGSQKHLQEIRVYDSLSKFVDKEAKGIRIAMSARTGKNRPAKPLPLLIDELIDSHTTENLRKTPIYVVLGPEDDGLATQHLDACHYAACLPTYGEFSSLNLGHAAQLSLYILQSKLDNENQIMESYDEAFQPVSLDSDTLVNQWLLNLGFDLSSPKSNAALFLNNMFKKSLPTQKEKDIFQKVVNQTIRKLKEIKNGKSCR